MHAIISNHVFQDGNKRTGLGAALAFCEINGFGLFDAAGSNDQTPIHPDKLYNFTIAVASGQRDLEAVRAWFEEYVRSIS
jgi:death-on-curing protein